MFFDNPGLNKLDESEKRRCDGLISHNECYRIVCEMKNNNSPGSDGLSA